MKNYKEIHNWFGDRGEFEKCLSINSKTKFKVINDNKNNRWLFIEDKEYNEVELYYMDSIYCECYDGYKIKKQIYKRNNDKFETEYIYFDWKKDNLKNIVNNIGE